MRGSVVVKSWYVHLGVVGLLAAATSTLAGVIQQVSATGAGLASSFVPITPCRLVDTRSGGDNVGTRSTPLGTSEIVTFTVWGTNGNCTIPATATGITANVTAVNSTESSFLTLWPAGVARPNASNLNYNAGSPPTPNSVTISLSTDGKMSTFNQSGTVNVIIDIVGYYQPSASDPAGPAGPAGPRGPAGTANRMSNAQIAQLRWDQDPGRAATIKVGNAPAGVAFDGTSIWVTNQASDTVSKINPTTNAVTATIGVGDIPAGVAYDGTNIWVVNNGSNTVSKIDPSTNTVTATINVAISPTRVAFDGTNIWVTNNGPGGLSKIDPATNTVTATVDVGQSTGVVFDGTNIWVATSTVAKVDPTTNTVIERVSGFVGQPVGLAYDGTNIWATVTDSHGIWKIDPTTNRVTATIPVDSDTPPFNSSAPYGVAYDGSNIWVTNLTIFGRLWKIDPDTNTVTAVITARESVGSCPAGVVYGGTNIWVANACSNTVSKLIPN